MTVGLFIARVIIGGLFIGHGLQKLFGWFGGHGIEGTAAFLGSLGLRPPRAWATLAGAGEAGAGALFLLGMLTPFASAAIIGIMTVAMITAHSRNGLWATAGGVELPLVYAVIAGLVAFTGPGAWSIDEAFARDMHGVVWGIDAMALGLMMGAIASFAARRPADDVVIEDDARSQHRKAA
jgi:putative oxidoreductase